MSSAHIAFVLNDIPYFLSHRRPLAEVLIQRGVRVTVVAPPNPVAEERLRDCGIGFASWVVSRRGVNPFREMASLIGLARILGRLSPDLIHNVTQKPVLYGSLAARIARCPAVVNAVSGLGYAFTEGSGGGGWLGRMMMGLHRLCHGGTGTRTIFQNPDDLGIFVESCVVPSSQARLIRGSGVDPERLQPVSELPRDPVVVLPARMLRDKGVWEVVEATKILRSQDIPIELWLAGGCDPGNPTAIDEAQLRDWGVAGVARWLGHVVDIGEVLRAARICCLPSYREGLPKSLIDAASCGLPIITCDVPGCREIVRHGDNGFLVPPRDPKALAAALKKLLDDYDLCVHMGKRGRERVIAEFSLDRVVRQHMEIYEELLGDQWPSTSII